MNRALVSCIVPVFNGERYIQQALESIHQQTYRPLEIIVVDDGSTDNTKEVVRNLGICVQYIEQGNLGPAAARNLGINLAKGDFVALLDSDDLWHQEKLTKQMARFQAKQELDVCITHINHFEDSEIGEERHSVSRAASSGQYPWIRYANSLNQAYDF
jgi:glycosyltransferase involved in cell wall biosynthesis